MQLVLGPVRRGERNPACEHPNQRAGGVVSGSRQHLKGAQLGAKGQPQLGPRRAALGQRLGLKLGQRQASRPKQLAVAPPDQIRQLERGRGIRNPDIAQLKIRQRNRYARIGQRNAQQRGLVGRGSSRERGGCVGRHLGSACMLR